MCPEVGAEDLILLSMNVTNTRRLLKLYSPRIVFFNILDFIVIYA